MYLVSCVLWLKELKKRCPNPLRSRPGKTCKCSKQLLKTFCSKSRYFEDILSQFTSGLKVIFDLNWALRASYCIKDTSTKFETWGGEWRNEDERLRMKD